MAQDQSEKIDDHCNEMYGHTNWGYLNTYSKEELNAKDHDIEDNIVYWSGEAEPDLPDGWSSCKECEEEFEGKTPPCNCIEEISELEKATKEG